jgi:uncharacterized membrane protein YhaH (DUF805 family)
MNFGQAITSGFQNYVNFQGRSSRSAFWFWALFTFIVSTAFQILSGGDNSSFFGLLGGLASLALLLPSLAVAVRRLHDIDRSGWFILLGLIPIVGAIILIVYYCQPSTAGTNRFDTASA